MAQAQQSAKLATQEDALGTSSVEAAVQVAAEETNAVPVSTQDASAIISIFLNP